LLMQARQVTDGLSNCNGFNVGNLPDDLKVHAHPSTVGWQPQVPAVAWRPTARFSRRRLNERTLPTARLGGRLEPRVGPSPGTSATQRERRP
jgi:hypothetical protein